MQNRELMVEYPQIVSAQGSHIRTCCIGGCSHHAAQQISWNRRAPPPREGRRAHGITPKA